MAVLYSKSYKNGMDRCGTAQISQKTLSFIFKHKKRRRAIHGAHVTAQIGVFVYLLNLNALRFQFS